jgi:hypothetical protein
MMQERRIPIGGGVLNGNRSRREATVYIAGGE